MIRSDNGEYGLGDSKLPVKEEAIKINTLCDGVDEIYALAETKMNL
jgi:hypothetical protein